MPKNLPPLTANQRMALSVLAGGDQRIDQVSWYPLRPSQLLGLLYSLDRRGLVDTVRMEGRARIWGLTAKGRAEVERLNAEGQEEDRMIGDTHEHDPYPLGRVRESIRILLEAQTRYQQDQDSYRLMLATLRSERAAPPPDWCSDPANEPAMRAIWEEEVARHEAA
jgi:DNA-binding PadR family transcriptional regulator